MKSLIKIRLATLEDAEELLAIYTPYIKETAITFEYEVPSVEAFKERIKQVQQMYPYLVAEKEGHIVGYAYAGPFKQRAAYDWSVETSIYINRNYKYQGIGTQLYNILEYLLKKQGILNVNACIACPEYEDQYLTRDSLKFHEKLGYDRVGTFHKCGYKFHRWYDMVWMEKHIGYHEKYQGKVKSIHEIKWVQEEV